MCVSLQYSFIYLFLLHWVLLKYAGSFIAVPGPRFSCGAQAPELVGSVVAST